jgi:hypothetical protein
VRPRAGQALNQNIIRNQILEGFGSEEDSISFRPNSIISGENVSIGLMYSQSIFFGYDLESDQQ